MKTKKFYRVISILLALVILSSSFTYYSFAKTTDTEAEKNGLVDWIWDIFHKTSVSVEGLPEGAVPSIEQISNPFTRKSGGTSVGSFLGFYDIKATDKESGKEIHPNGEFEVRLQGVKLEKDQSVYVIHVLDTEDAIKNTPNVRFIDDAGFVAAFKDQAKITEKATGNKDSVAVEIIKDVTVDNGDVVFMTKSFSIFAVADNPIITVNFYESTAENSEPVASIRVKQADTINEAEYARVVYEPGIQSVTAAKALFRGWTTDPNYTVENADSALTIQGVRQDIADKLGGANPPATINYYAMLFKRYTVTFYDELHVTCFGVDYALQRFDDAESGKKLNFKVNVPYTPYTESASFQGWKLITEDGQGNPISTYKDHLYGVFTQLGENESPTSTTIPDTIGDDADNYTYNNPTWVQITGDISLYAFAPGGNWLLFDENGKGGTYYAPQFVEDDHSTSDPRTAERPAVRYGYTFDGWYYFPDGNAPAAQNGIVDLTNAVVFPFNKKFTKGEDNNIYYDNKLVTNHKITVYAKWKPNTTAGYSVIIWKQNIDADGYDFDRVINLTGAVGSIIDTVSRQGTGDSSYVRVNGIDYNGTDYKGFHLSSFDTDVTIVTEGSSVVNVYYNRTQYTLTFQAQGVGYSYTETTSNDGEQYGLVNGEYIRIIRDNNGFTEWYLAYDNGGWFVTNWVEHTGTVYRRQGQRYYPTTDYSHGDGQRYYRSNGWGYDELTWRSRTTYGWSYTDEYGTSHPYTGTRYTRSQAGSGTWGDVYSITALYGQPIGEHFPISGNNVSTEWRWSPQNSSTFNNVLVYIDIMPAENVVFHNSSSTASTKYMEFYVEALPGQTVDRTWSGKNFVKYGNTIPAKYNFFTEAEDFLEFNGFNKFGSDPAFSNGRADVSSGGTIYFYYTRKAYSINFMDGTYVDGDGNVQDEINRNQLDEVDNVIYGLDISSYNNYKLDDYQGYVFEGWYLDRTCQTLCNFKTMPEGGITVFAKWRKIQYRVFLHPNAVIGESNDESLDWGSSTQSMTFRVDNGGTISIPTGRRTLYNFLGWYTDEELEHYYFADTRLSEDLTNDDGSDVLSEYNKSTDVTDIMDKWGDISGNTENPNGWNSDATGYNGGDRFWITKKIDLYAKWSYKLVGAKGIYVEYYSADGYFVDSANNHFTLFCDDYLYADNTKTYAIAASYPNDTNLHFSYWQQMIWNATTQKWEPGSAVRLPGEKFSVQLQESGLKIERRVKGSSDAWTVWPTMPTDENDGYEYKYTIRLQANYLPAVAQKTVLVYDANGGSFVADSIPTGFTSSTVTEDEVTYAIISKTLDVNSVFNILSGTTILTREGFVFKGWSFTRNGEKWEYDENGEYSADNLDRDNPTGNDHTNTLYAIWEIKKFDIAVDKDVVSSVAADSTAEFSVHYTVDGGTEQTLTVTASDDPLKLIEDVPYNSTVVIWEVLTEAQQVLFETDHGADNKITVTLSDGTKPTDVPYTTIKITNTRRVGKIKITKALSSGSATDEQFMFRITGGTLANPLTVTVKAGKSVTVAELQPGTYTVTEVTAWSWRYDLDTTVTGNTVERSVVIDGGETEEVTFTNKRNDKNWLYGENAIDNAYGN